MRQKEESGEGARCFVVASGHAASALPLQGFGYVHLSVEADSLLFRVEGRIPRHEFRYFYWAGNPQSAECFLRAVKEYRI